MDQNNIAPPGASTSEPPAPAGLINQNLNALGASTDNDTKIQSSEQSSLHNSTEENTHFVAHRTPSITTSPGASTSRDAGDLSLGGRSSIGNMDYNTQSPSKALGCILPSQQTSTGRKTYNDLLSLESLRAPVVGSHNEAMAPVNASTSERTGERLNREQDQQLQDQGDFDNVEHYVPASTSGATEFGYAVASVTRVKTTKGGVSAIPALLEAASTSFNKTKRPLKRAMDSDSESSEDASSTRNKKRKAFKATKKSKASTDDDEDLEDEVPKKGKASTSATSKPSKKKGRKTRADMTEDEKAEAQAKQRERDRRAKSTRQSGSFSKKIDANLERMLKGQRVYPFTGDVEPGNEKMGQIIDLQHKVYTTAKDGGLTGINKMKKDAKKWKNWVIDSSMHDKLIANMKEAAAKDDDEDETETPEPLAKPSAASTRKSNKSKSSKQLSAFKSRKGKPTIFAEEDEEDDNIATGIDQFNDQDAAEDSGNVKVKDEPVDSGDEGTSFLQLYQQGKRRRGIDQYPNRSFESAGRGGREADGEDRPSGSRIDQLLEGYNGYDPNAHDSDDN